MSAVGLLQGIKLQITLSFLVKFTRLPCGLVEECGGVSFPVKFTGQSALGNRLSVDKHKIFQADHDANYHGTEYEGKL